jgi:hypothetical protein
MTDNHIVRGGNVNFDDIKPRLRQLIDEDPFKSVDTSHELAPYVPPKEKSGSEQIAEKAIAILRQTGQHVLDQFKPMHDQLERAEQMVIKAMADGEENIRAQMRVFEASAKILQQIEAQMAEAIRPLVEINNGK